MGKFLEKIKEELAKEPTFIGDFREFINDVYGMKNIDIRNAKEQDEYRLVLQTIHENNSHIYNGQQKTLKDSEKIMEAAVDLDYELEKEPEAIEENVSSTELTKWKATPNNLEEWISNLIHQEEIAPFLGNLTTEDINNLKVAIFKNILKIEQKVKFSIVLNPSENISDLQTQLASYKNLLKKLSKVGIDLEKEETEQKVSSNIILVPSIHNSSCLLEDIKEYPEKKNEIKKMFEKVMSGYFLETNDTKSLMDKEKLCEYKHPNGIRILYRIMPDNYYAICSLFFKDKQKSTLINQYYEEAIKRFNNAKSVLENYKSPDFQIEQAEWLGELYAYFEEGKNLNFNKKGEK